MSDNYDVFTRQLESVLLCSSRDPQDRLNQASDMFVEHLKEHVGLDDSIREYLFRLYTKLIAYRNNCVQKGGAALDKLDFDSMNFSEIEDHIESQFKSIEK